MTQESKVATDLTRARLYVALGAALTLAATMVIVWGRGSGYFQIVPGRVVTASVVPPVLAALGLALLERNARLGGLLLIMAAGGLLGLSSIASSDGTGLLWMPGGLLLALGAFKVLAAKRQGQRK